MGWLRAAGVEEITVRLDKGFFAKRMVETLDGLGVFYVLKLPNHAFVREAIGPWRRSERAAGIFPKAETVYRATGTVWGARLLSLQGRRPLPVDEATLALDTYEVTEISHVLTNVPGIHALTAWRRYNAGAVVEQRIEELGQLSVGRTAIDDVDGNALLWACLREQNLAPSCARDPLPPAARNLVPALSQHWIAEPRTDRRSTLAPAGSRITIGFVWPPPLRGTQSRTLQRGETAPPVRARVYQVTDTRS